MRTLIFLLFCISSKLVFSQDIQKDFGKVSFYDLNLKEYSKDKTADAVKLYDKGNSFFAQTESGFEVFFEHSFKIKIFKKSGFKWGEVEIPYYFTDDTYEKVFDIKAYTYNIENNAIKRDEIDPKNIFDEKKNEYWRNKKFALPNIKEGSVIEVMYKISSPRIFDFRGWEFQSSIPTLYSEYNAKMIPFYSYNYILQGTSKLDVFESFEERGLKERFMGIEYNFMNYKFGMKDVPAFIEDPYITSADDYIIKIDFQLSNVQYPDGYKREVITTWPKLINDILKEPSFGKYLDAAEKAGLKSLNLTELSSKSKTEKLETIINLIKANFNWDNNYGYFAYKSLKEFQKEKTGNIGCINLYLAGLLKAAGFEAYPVILSTRKHGKIKADYPFVHYFNYVAVLVMFDGKNILADATEPMLPYTHIPARCINDKGLIIRKDEENWVNLTNSEPSYVNRSINLNFSNNLDSLFCNVTTSYTLHEAYDIKAKYKDNTDKIKEAFHENGYTTVDSITTENYNETKKDYKIKIKATYPVESIENKLYISPFLSEALSQNPLKQATRMYPVDFIYPFGKKFKSIITIPSGYKTDFLPQPLKINNEKVYIEYQITTIDNKHLLVNGIYTFKKSVYNPEEYTDIKYYFNEIVKKFNEKVVLVKE